VTRARRIYVVVGIAEFDAKGGLGYNTAALIGPHISANIASTASMPKTSFGLRPAISVSRFSTPSSAGSRC